jgi:hypothetical protein
MAFKLADRVKETTTTTGTGTVTLLGAITNFETFSANLSNSDTTYYAIVDNTNGDFEVGLGTYSSNTLARTTPIASSNSNSAVNFGVGTKEVFITAIADKIVMEDGSNNVSIGGTVTATAFSGSGASLTGVDVVNDTSPQLGGALDVQTHDIVTTSNRDLELAPDGTGRVVVKGGTNPGAIVLNCQQNTHGQTLKSQDHDQAASNTLLLPDSGDAGSQDLVAVNISQTLTNKTLTTPVIEEIDSTGSITLDAATDIVLDAGGADVTLKDDGTTFGSLTNSSGELVIKSGSTPTTAVTFSGANATFAGNLTVNGTTTTIDTTNTTVKDTLLGLNSGATSNSNDCGIIIERGSTGNDALFIWDESEDKFALGTTTDNASSTGNLDMTKGTLVADVEGNVTATTISLGGSNLTTTATLSTGISNGNVLVATSGVADNDFLRVDGTSIEGRSASELATDIGAATTDDATALAIALG